MEKMSVAQLRAYIKKEDKGIKLSRDRKPLRKAELLEIAKKLMKPKKQRIIDKFLDPFKEYKNKPAYIPKTQLLTLLFLNTCKANNCDLVFTMTSLFNLPAFRAGIIVDKQGKLLDKQQLPSIKKQIKKHIKEGKKMIVIPLSIDLDNAGHQNILIYDIEKNTLERFEPHGSKVNFREPFDTDKFDKEINKTFSFLNAKYIRPTDFLDEDSFQSLRFDNEFDEGYCVLWCIFYTEMRLVFPDISPKELVLQCIDYFKTEKRSVKFIENYWEHLYNQLIKGYGKKEIDNLLKKEPTIEDERELIKLMVKYTKEHILPNVYDKRDKKPLNIKIIYG